MLQNGYDTSQESDFLKLPIGMDEGLVNKTSRVPMYWIRNLSLSASVPNPLISSICSKQFSFFRPDRRSSILVIPQIAVCRLLRSFASSLEYPDSSQTLRSSPHVTAYQERAGRGVEIAGNTFSTPCNSRSRQQAKALVTPPEQGTPRSQELTLFFFN